MSGRRHEVQRHAVDAVAQPGRRRTVLEDVAEVTAAAVAVHLGAPHEHGCRRPSTPTAPSSGAKKLGQPVPLSNLRLGLWYTFPGDFRQLMLNGMRQDHSWAWPGQHYVNIYDYIRHK